MKLLHRDIELSDGTVVKVPYSEDVSKDDPRFEMLRQDYERMLEGKQ